ncbi:hypothetical protein FF80_02908 [Devosia sp. LC5]|nr:hypothetical protein FF80_02908 [Devosia sp. LC5]
MQQNQRHQPRHDDPSARHAHRPPIHRHDPALSISNQKTRQPCRLRRQQCPPRAHHAKAWHKANRHYCRHRHHDPAGNHLSPRRSGKIDDLPKVIGSQRQESRPRHQQWQYISTCLGIARRQQQSQHRRSEQQPAQRPKSHYAPQRHKSPPQRRLPHRGIARLRLGRRHIGRRNRLAQHDKSLPHHIDTRAIGRNAHRAAKPPQHNPIEIDRDSPRRQRPDQRPAIMDQRHQVRPLRPYHPIPPDRALEPRQYRPCRQRLRQPHRRQQQRRRLRNQQSQRPHAQHQHPAQQPRRRHFGHQQMRPPDLDRADMHDKAQHQQRQPQCLGWPQAPRRHRHAQPEHAQHANCPQRHQQSSHQPRRSIWFEHAKMGMHQPLEQPSEHNESRRKADEVIAKHCRRRQSRKDRHRHQVEQCRRQS